MLLKIIQPKKPPKAIGIRNFRFFLISLKNPRILSINFSYIPNIIQSTPLLIPGKIAPAPIKIPFIKLEKDCI